MNSIDLNKIFESGIFINEQLTKMTRISTHLMNNDAEVKVYLQVARFYNQVIFKPKEGVAIMLKAKEQIASK